VQHVNPKWRAPRKADVAAWARVAAGDIWWDRRAVSRQARRQALATAAARTLIARRRSARRTVGLAVANPAGHGPVRWSLHDVEHRGCATCEQARGLVAERLHAAHLSSKAITARP